MKSRRFVLFLSFLFIPAIVSAQNATFSSVAINATANTTSLTAISPPDPKLQTPIFAISRSSNVVTVSTSDPSDTDNYALQSSQVGTWVTISGISVDPSNVANGMFQICGPPTPGCINPTTYTFSYASTGADFSVSGSAQIGSASVGKSGCPLTPTTYFSFCGDPLLGAGLTGPSDKALVEFVATQDNVGSVLFASSLGDGNRGTTRATGCEQGFIESGNEWVLDCAYQHTFSHAIDFDLKNELFVMDVGAGDGTTAGEFAMSGTRKVAVFGPSANRILTIDMGTVPSGSVAPSIGTLRFRNGSTLCWENVGASGSLCAGTNANDKFALDGGVVTATYGTATNCISAQGNCGAAAAGAISISAGNTSVFVNTSAVTAVSEIFLQEDSSLGASLDLICNSILGRTYLITNRMPGVGFTITTSAAPVTNPACLSYHVVN
jgi:hypothetical protein